VIYIHVPFCKSFCTYCGFYSEIASSGQCIESYLRSLKNDINSKGDQISGSTQVDTLYIGGGTPSVLPLDVFKTIIDTIKIWHPADFEEFTIEVNPEDIVEKGHEFVDGLLNLGVNRFSMGVQSFDDEILKWMNRRHNSERSLKAFEILRSAGVKNISVDLIFGISNLSKTLWKETISKTIDLHPEHISAYQLSIEESSTLAQMIERGKYTEADENLCRDQYDILCEELKKAGYNHYEVSNFALPNFEARHNSAYWQRIPYVGLGPGSHSLSRNGQDVRSWNSEKLSDWTQEIEILSPEQVRIEEIMLGLRTAKGIEYQHFNHICNSPLLQEFLSKGYLELVKNGSQVVKDYIRIPEDHFFVSDDIIRDLI